MNDNTSKDLFSRRKFLESSSAAIAAAGMLASDAAAQGEKQPYPSNDERKPYPTKDDRSASAPGPGNPEIDAQNPDSFLPPPSDAGGVQAQAEDHGHEGKGHDKHYSKDHDRLAARGWYDEHQGHLPPGLAKRDQLPPGLQRQLVVRSTLPPGLQKRLQPVPQDLEVRLTPPPPECAHVLIGGNIVLLNRRANLVVDIVAF
jgi:hypothetical protein